LELYGSKGGLVDIGAQDVPARREAGLIEDERPLGIGDDAVMMPDHEVTGGLANVDAVVAVSGMACDLFVLLVESSHGLPGERDTTLQFARVRGQIGMLPCPSRRDVLLACPDAIPQGEPQIRVLGGMVGAFQEVWRNVGFGEVGYRIAAWFKKQEHV